VRNQTLWHTTVLLTLRRDFGVLSDIAYKCQWKFKDNRAAFMVMHRARKIGIPSPFLKMALKDENPVPEIRTKNVVTGVWSCPSFAMYLSNKCRFSFRRNNVSVTLITPHIVASEHVRIALRASNTGSGQETGWYAEGNVGVYQFGSLPALSNEAYLPLYQLQKIRKRNLRPRRDGRDQNEIMYAALSLSVLTAEQFQMGHGGRTLA
jgi:hypothetical protein